MLMLVSRHKQTLMVMMQRYVPQQMAMSRPDIARQVAGYMLACIPQLVIFAGGMKYYIQGVTSGAIKG
jgi:multiple sugar transport system permease protein/raffinose/stachyose/melibiose transport system permease protein